ncbi:hypothetical protein GCK72_023572 [Caenorhabditis remanei]|uniref:Uncharacterized protein n=1 Tax=Caenorhabditis remanei TaxID=31234 RepID=A0A6A5FX40_CAERE|nr:hypothetical protein GCK72_023572 [Caenorhabditis remanei]KAF1747113.1 hypothetical protein GCK72_023572 [Caenorhabditis remanei]
MEEERKQPKVGDIGVIQSWPIIVTKSDRKRFSYKFIGLGPTDTGKKATNGRFLALHSEDTIPKKFFEGTPYAGNINKALKIAKDILKEKAAKWGSEIGRKHDINQKVIRSENAINYIKTQKSNPRISKKKKKSSAKSKKTAKSKSPQQNKQQVEDLIPNIEAISNGEASHPIAQNEKVPVEAEIITDDKETLSAIEGTRKEEVEDARKTCERVGKAPKIEIVEEDKGTTSGEANAQEQVEISRKNKFSKEESPLDAPEVEQMDIDGEQDQFVEPQEDADDSVEEERVIQEANTSNSSWRDFFGRARFW